MLYTERVTTISLVDALAFHRFGKGLHGSSESNLQIAGLEHWISPLIRAARVHTASGSQDVPVGDECSCAGAFLTVVIAVVVPELHDERELVVVGDRSAGACLALRKPREGRSRR